jgi:integrase
LASIGARLERQTTRDFLAVWLRGKNESTATRYKTMTDALLKFLGPKADHSLTAVSSGDIEAFKNELGDQVAPATLAITIKVLRSAFKKAAQLQLIDKNPAAFVETPARDSVHKEDFTKKQIDDLLAVANAEWKTMVYLGKWTGQRLQDLANLRRSNIDLVEDLVRLVSRKTGRIIEIPMAPQLREHLESLPIGDDPDAYLLLTLAGKRSGWLSNQFYAIMSAIGIVEKRENHKGTGKGRAAKRNVSKYGFHSFRGTATSLLKNAGVPEAVVMDIIGHDSKAVSRRYTKIDLQSKRRAINRMAKYVGCDNTSTSPWLKEKG